MLKSSPNDQVGLAKGRATWGTLNHYILALNLITWRTIQITHIFVSMFKHAQKGDEKKTKSFHQH